ncbi:MAG: hypothetical protein J1F02_00295 [Lachnospiraceae bacterium]|nr:hypothetical protein [Lachnospiraceae bacterium]
MEENQQANNNMAVASLVLGIVSVVGLCIPYVSSVTWICAIVGIVLGAKANSVNKTGMGTAGIILSIIGIVLEVIAVIAVIAFGAAIYSALAL